MSSSCSASASVASATSNRAPALTQQRTPDAKGFFGKFGGSFIPPELQKQINEIDRIGGARIYLKREDLNRSGAHRPNYCMGEALLAKFLGKKKLIAETGADLHGIALATAGAHFGIPVEVHMGGVDIAKEHPNVVRMKILGAKVVPVSHGSRSMRGKNWGKKKNREGRAAHLLFHFLFFIC
ncbi:MAG: pyridoxal-phosphate dependent enzyme [Puniceicoccales bacterium]|jgi:tryptophan synthase beta chain|nr:pyridoxal-phosphate dependent enzyme [Puniceicoccales bacterium]